MQKTIEEIKVLNREIFIAAGGNAFGYVKALNASWAHAEVIADVIERTMASRRAQDNS